MVATPALGREKSMLKQSLIKSSWTKCSVCGWTALSFWMISEDAFPLKCNNCGIKTALQIEWDDLSAEEQDVLLKALA